MINNLRVKNVALIDEAEVNFGSGLNILTGETGAGKSILIDSITFLLGDRPGRDFIRAGKDMAVVEGILTAADEEGLSLFAEMGIEIGDDRRLLISRSVNSQGRSSCRVNGRSVTVGMLKEIASWLVDVHGQHQHQSLLNPNKHIILLDRFCGSELEKYKAELAELIKVYRETVKALKNLQGAPGQREAQMEILQFQVEEIGRAKLKAGEEEALTARRNRLSGVDKLVKSASEALSLLYGGEEENFSASDLISRARRSLEEIAKLDEEKRSLAETLDEAAVLLADVVNELSGYLSVLDADPQELERLEERLDIIYRLKKKYGGTVSDILAHHEKISAQLEKLADSEGEIRRLHLKRRTELRAIAAKCNEMTALRRKYSDTVQSLISEALRDLGMPHVRFEIAMEKKREFSGAGNDKLEFMFSPNLGEVLKPLSQIASGGEMSRVMLALKTVMADADRIGTLIFDEIDAGVSGRTAQQVAEKLAQISKKHQILCITHLPQIAAMADNHFLISKTAESGKTITTVTELRRDDMINELARLIGGAKITAATIKAAKEMKDLVLHD